MDNNTLYFYLKNDISEGIGMSKFSDDTMQGLLEAVEIKNGSIPLVERKGMDYNTLYVDDLDTDLINSLIEIRKDSKMSQSDLAKKIGSNQQAISRFEKNEHNPSLRLFHTIVNALGYELQIVKKHYSTTI